MDNDRPAAGPPRAGALTILLGALAFPTTRFRTSTDAAIAAHAASLLDDDVQARARLASVRSIFEVFWARLAAKLKAASGAVGVLRAHADAPPPADLFRDAPALLETLSDEQQNAVVAAAVTPIWLWAVLEGGAPSAARSAEATEARAAAEEILALHCLVGGGDPATERAARLLSMVHHLHRAGYQRIRISPGISPSGCYWRGVVTYAANVQSDGFSIRDFDVEAGLVAPYTSGQGARYFGWSDGAGMDARALADAFLRRFPVIARLGEGRDWAYAGWLTDVLGRAELGNLLALYADYPLDEAEMADWIPPPP